MSVKCGIYKVRRVLVCVSAMSFPHWLLPQRKCPYMDYSAWRFHLQQMDNYRGMVYI